MESTDVEDFQVKLKYLCNLLEPKALATMKASDQDKPIALMVLIVAGWEIIETAYKVLPEYPELLKKAISSPEEAIQVASSPFNTYKLTEERANTVLEWRKTLSEKYPDLVRLYDIVGVMLTEVLSKELYKLLGYTSQLAFFKSLSSGELAAALNLNNSNEKDASVSGRESTIH